MKIRQIEIVRRVSDLFWKIRPKGSFEGSASFWQKRYRDGGTSGPGSYGELAEFKSKVINEFLKKHEIQNVIDFGCGDGNQISNIEFPDYLGFDVSEYSIERCRKFYQNKENYRFKLVDNYNGEEADLVISLDVIFHLVEDMVYNEYMERLFSASNKYVIIYSPDFEELCLNPFSTANQVRYRKFSDWIDENRKNWMLYQHIKNPFSHWVCDYMKDESRTDFFIYKRT